MLKWRAPYLEVGKAFFAQLKVEILNCPMILCRLFKSQYEGIFYVIRCEANCYGSPKHLEGVYI